MSRKIISSNALRRCSRRRAGAAARGWAFARHWVLGLSLAFTCQFALAQAVYRIQPLGVLGGCTSFPPTARALNGTDEVTGIACNAHGDDHAFLWKNDGTPMVDLGPRRVGTYSEGNAINGSGLVTGSAEDTTGLFFGFVSSGNGAPMTRIPNGLGGDTVTGDAINDLGQVTGNAAAADGTSHAFLWKNDGSPMLDLGIPPDGFDYATGYAINASGQVAGTSGLSSEPSAEAFVWKNDGTPMLDLTPRGGSAYLINASGQVAGTNVVVINGGDRGRAFLWRNDGTLTLHSLGTLGGAESFPTALNDAGQVVGWSHTLRFKNPHAFIWMNDGTAMRDIGTLGGTESRSNDINASGQVTGWAYTAGDSVFHAFLWRNDGTKIQDLNALIDPLDPLKPHVTLTNGDFINGLSDIVAEGTDSRTGLGGLYLLQGTVLTLNPRSLAFGNVPVHTTSAVKSVTMANTSSKAVAITTIALTGSAAAQFATTNNCGHSLAGHANCVIKVTLKPTSTGAKSASLDVNGGGRGLRTVTLTGTGT